MNWEEQIFSYDTKKNIVIPGDKQETVAFCVKQFIEIAQRSLAERGAFNVALSGGSTPNAIYKLLSEIPYRNQLDWTKVFLFWSDERSVPPNNPESNFYTAMQSGLSLLPIPKDHIFRMKAEDDIETESRAYEKLILDHIPSKKFDLVMLGMGEDGHTASLFPHTHGLHTDGRLIIANYIPQKNTWRMTMTYQCIQLAHHVSIYVLGANKAKMVVKVLTGPFDPDLFPIQRIGTEDNKALWILDNDAAADIETQS